MSRYDLSRASDVALLAVARVTVSKLWEGAPAVDDEPSSLDPHTRRCLEAFASVLIHDQSEGFPELVSLRYECRLKTRAEYDREIGDMLRARAAASSESSWTFDPLHALVDASRSAPEGEP